MTEEGCLGYSDGRGDYDCEYEFSGEILCEECIYGPASINGSSGKLYNPEFPREEQNQIYES